MFHTHILSHTENTRTFNYVSWNKYRFIPYCHLTHH